MCSTKRREHKFNRTVQKATIRIVFFKEKKLNRILYITVINENDIIICIKIIHLFYYFKFIILTFRTNEKKASFIYPKKIPGKIC